MTIGHLLFAVVTTLYILVAIQLEERDLVDAHCAEYEEYKKQCQCFCLCPNGDKHL